MHGMILGRRREVPIRLPYPISGGKQSTYPKRCVTNEELGAEDDDDELTYVL